MSNPEYINKKWTAFLATGALAAGQSKQVMDERKLMFFAGAEAAFQVLIMLQEDDNEDTAVAQMHALHEELQSFALHFATTHTVRQ